MPESARIWVGTSGLPAGTRLVLYGPDELGGVDYAAAEAVTRVSPLGEPGRGRDGAARDRGPLYIGPACAAPASVCLRTTPQVFGRRRYGVRAIDGTTGAVGAAGEVDVFTNAEPVPPNVLLPTAGLVSGAVQFRAAGQRLT